MNQTIRPLAPPQTEPTTAKADLLSFEIWLVIITLVALIGSVTGTALAAPLWLIMLLNLTAYAAGGYHGVVEILLSFGVIKSYEQTHADSCCAREADEPAKLNVDLLMILAALGAAAIGSWHEGALLLFLFSLSNVLQGYAIGRSRQAIKGLLKLYPNQATIKDGDTLRIVAVAAIQPGDVILIQPGERIPVDGIVCAGSSSIDQSPITGESIPVDKTSGDKVFAGTLNQQGALDVEATGQVQDTMLSRIIQMVENAQDSKAPTQRFLEVFEQRYAAAILIGVALLIVVPPVLNLVDFESNFYRAMVVLVAATPCALVISTPAAFISAIASAARRGVLFKGGAYLEGLAVIKAVAFDKTGTLTMGKPAVTDVIGFGAWTEEQVLRLAGSAEARSEHPLAKAVTMAARARGLTLIEPTDFKGLPGRGIRTTLEGIVVEVGSPTSMEAEGMILNADIIQIIERLEGEGKTVTTMRRAGDVIAVIALADQVRPAARQMIAELKRIGVQTVMLTGDNPQAAASIARSVGVDRVYAGLLPDEKVGIIEQLQREIGATAMVGDGVNDAPALATASIGIAMGAAGSDVALETADVVLIGDRLELIPFAISLSQKARRVVWQNIAFALAVIVTLLMSAFLIDLPLPLSVLGHEGSTIIVVMNGLIQLLLIPEFVRRRDARTTAPTTRADALPPSADRSRAARAETIG